MGYTACAGRRRAGDPELPVHVVASGDEGRGEQIEEGVGMSGWMGSESPSRCRSGLR